MKFALLAIALWALASVPVGIMIGLAIKWGGR